MSLLLRLTPIKNNSSQVVTTKLRRRSSVSLQDRVSAAPRVSAKGGRGSSRLDAEASIQSDGKRRASRRSRSAEGPLGAVDGNVVSGSRAIAVAAALARLTAGAQASKRNSATATAASGKWRAAALRGGPSSTGASQEAITAESGELGRATSGASRAAAAIAALSRLSAAARASTRQSDTSAVSSIRETAGASGSYTEGSRVPLGAASAGDTDTSVVGGGGSMGDEGGLRATVALSRATNVVSAESGLCSGAMASAKLRLAKASGSHLMPSSASEDHSDGDAGSARALRTAPSAGGKGKMSRRSVSLVADDSGAGTTFVRRSTHAGTASRAVSKRHSITRGRSSMASGRRSINRSVTFVSAFPPSKLPTNRCAQCSVQISSLGLSACTSASLIF